MIIIENHISLLKENGWEVSFNNLNNTATHAYNTESGCEISGMFTTDFVLNKIKELRKNLNTPFVEFDFKSALEEYGYSIISESPFEVKNRRGGKIKGECCLFLREHLKNLKKYS